MAAAHYGFDYMVNQSEVEDSNGSVVVHWDSVAAVGRPLLQVALEEMHLALGIDLIAVEVQPTKD